MANKLTDATYVAAHKIKALIDANPLGRKTITMLSLEVGIGRNQLQRAFKEITGVTVKRYRLEARMQVGCDLLMYANMKVSEVARKCGYRKHPKNFYRDFKSVFSVTPEEWMRSHVQSYMPIRGRHEQK
jgi:AraC-like DNA-binding protein